jgi:hypothetical protein
MIVAATPSVVVAFVITDTGTKATPSACPHRSSAQRAA